MADGGVGRRGLYGDGLLEQRDKIKPTLLNKEEVLNLLREAIADAGSQSEFARRKGVHRTALPAILNGRKNLQPKILTALGLKKVDAYTRR